MSKLEHSFAFLAVLGSLALATSASAQPFGQADLSGAERLEVKGCGRMGGPVSFDLAIAGNGAWTLDTGSGVYTGTSTGNQRVARLTLASTSLAALEAALEADATALCGEAVNITALNARAALVVNKRQTRAHFVFRAGGQGATANDEGRGVYGARARGQWMPALTQ